MTRGLSRERVVIAALEIVDEHGLPGLSMRKIASRLGVEAMSLYRHVENKRDLLDALHEHLIGGLRIPDTGPWQERVRTVALDFRTVMAAHPKLVPLLASRPASTPRALDVLEAGVTVLEEAGFDEQEALIAFQTVFCFVVGHCAFHMADGTAPDAWADQEFAGGLDLLLRGMDRSRG